MSNKHFSLLLDTLELDSLLETSSFSKFSLENIKRDSKNKVWTFNFKGETLPEVSLWIEFFRKLKESFFSDYEIKFQLELSKQISEKDIKNYWSFVVSELFSNAGYRGIFSSG